MRRGPQEIILQLAHALTSASKGETVSLGKLHRTTGLHYETIRKYGFMIDFIQTRLPRIILDESGTEKGLMVLDTPDLDTSPEEDVLLYLFDKGIFKKGAAIAMPDWLSEEKRSEIKRTLEERSLIEEESGRVWLLADGIIKGAELADRRQELTLGPIAEEMQGEESAPREEEMPDDGDSRQPVIRLDSVRKPEKGAGRFRTVEAV